jgi:four helix bundle protein
MKENVVQEKSYAFALRVVKLYQYLCQEHREYELSKQVLRSGTSIGANIEEALGAQSDKDFLHKISISYKEARETHYWIRLLGDTGYIASKLKQSLLADCEALLKIIGSIRKKLREKIDKNNF